ncbi:hypothetical protein RIR_jg40689.t1 [Rhizophagus irregularis DAOM 181602=DAOM 197198]|uniref:Uncharacterized protein n=1 Tax=Rhizophagus irregularis (strain DAOM 181602 / DAOM 197198 / MUCL 43194) TaxID=747089 RepID=U9UUY7_RHIID|nr:hypothetical protein RIR_jg40689.t1 [Rhizophagus irregularis DAOM 181602=DAOM 197198]
MNKTLYYSGPSKFRKPSNIITWLDNVFFMNTYRKLNSKKRCFTWKNKNISTRIDYIWTNPKFEANIKKSHIYQSIDITDSDYNITLAEISFTSIIVTNNKGGRREKKTQHASYMIMRIPPMNSRMHMRITLRSFWKNTRPSDT